MCCGDAAQGDLDAHLAGSSTWVNRGWCLGNHHSRSHCTGRRVNSPQTSPHCNDIITITVKRSKRRFAWWLVIEAGTRTQGTLNSGARVPPSQTEWRTSPTVTSLDCYSTYASAPLSCFLS